MITFILSILVGIILVSGFLVVCITIADFITISVKLRLEGEDPDIFTCWLRMKFYGRVNAIISIILMWVGICYLSNLFIS